MSILCFGGSFNPIHRGHMVCAQFVAAQGGYERVLLIPNAQPPHKPDAVRIAPAADRLAMCQLAAEAENAKPPIDSAQGQRQAAVRFEVDDIEMRRGGMSYTLDTARELKHRGIDPVHWLIGADMLMYLPKWHQPRQLLQEVDFIIMARPGWVIDWDRLPLEFRHLQSNVVAAPLIDISATEIRARAARGEPIDELVPAPVARYIAEHELYRD
jgi:nicotinate-nucleotide adenylyltransferase